MAFRTKSPLFNTHVTSALSMRLWKDFNVSISSALLPVNYDVQMPLENFHFIKIWMSKLQRRVLAKSDVEKDKLNVILQDIKELLLFLSLFLGFGRLHESLYLLKDLDDSKYYH